MIKRVSRILFFLTSFGLASLYAQVPSEASTTKYQVVYRTYDFDDTIMSTLSEIFIFNKTTGETEGISTQNFARVGPQLGKPGKYQNWTTHGDSDSEPSFLDFRDVHGVDTFAKMIEWTLSAKRNQRWMAPAWQDFVADCSTEEGARRVSIATARGHSAESIRRGLEVLQKRGLIKFIPPIENIFSVGNPDYRSQLLVSGGITERASTGEFKVKAMTEILLRMESDLQKQNGKGLFIFSDDDFSNIDNARKAFEKIYLQFRHVDIEVRYVGRLKTGQKNFTWKIGQLGPVGNRCSVAAVLN